ncbi:50S ribosomal protein L32 [Candidatus Falkowbacteria bacterium]|jgi:large subunit ribosomal protein L32|nr:50S ribosomal protein L32 [Candidatus Falkowbacteria bacterium]MBT7007570.1 50S ribosomal protein L32 [Candidatus Falkowbacteria bacterium]
MSVPKHRKTHSKTRMGRSHEALKTVKPNACPKCGAPKKPHIVCKECGTYKGKQVIKTKADVLAKRDAKRKAAETKQREKMSKLKNK